MMGWDLQKPQGCEALNAGNHPLKNPLVREPWIHISITWVSWSRETTRKQQSELRISLSSFVWVRIPCVSSKIAMLYTSFKAESCNDPENVLVDFVFFHHSTSSWKSLSMNGFLKDHHIFVTVTNWAQCSKATSAFAMEPMGFLFMASCTRISAKRGLLVLSIETPADHRCYLAFDKSLGSLSLGNLTRKLWRSDQSTCD